MEFFACFFVFYFISVHTHKSVVFISVAYLWLFLFYFNIRDKLWDLVFPASVYLGDDNCSADISAGLKYPRSWISALVLSRHASHVSFRDVLRLLTATPERGRGHSVMSFLKSQRVASPIRLRRVPRDVPPWERVTRLSVAALQGRGCGCRLCGGYAKSSHVAIWTVTRTVRILGVFSCRVIHAPRVWKREHNRDNGSLKKRYIKKQGEACVGISPWFVAREQSDHAKPRPCVSLSQWSTAVRSPWFRTAPRATYATSRPTCAVRMVSAAASPAAISAASVRTASLEPTVTRVSGEKHHWSNIKEPIMFEYANEPYSSESGWVSNLNKVF